MAPLESREGCLFSACLVLVGARLGVPGVLGVMAGPVTVKRQCKRGGRIGIQPLLLIL